MKKVYTYLLLTVLLTGVTVKSADAQVVAVGHATAEVVESVSASSSAVTLLTLNTSSPSINSTSSGLSAATSGISSQSNNLKLGEFKVTSTGAYIYNVIVNDAVAKDSDGNNLVFATSVGNDFTSDNQVVDTNSRIVLRGKVKQSEEQLSGTYSGSYKMVIAYN